MTTRRHIRMRLDATVRTLGHLAVWLGLYFGGTVTLYAHAAGIPVSFTRPWILAWLAAAATGTGVYLFDRVKIRAEWSENTHDQPTGPREAFVEERSTSVRALAIGLLAFASLFAALLSPMLVLVTLGAFMAVTLYAGLPFTRSERGGRLKDLPGIKYAIACLGIAVLASAFAHAAGEVDPYHAETGPAFMIVLLIVLADMVLCDLDDLDADRRAGSCTLPVLLGPRVAMALAWAALCIALLPAWPTGASASPAGRWLWKLGLLSTTAAIVLLRRPGTRRDWIDARLGLLAIAVLILG